MFIDIIFICIYKINYYLYKLTLPALCSAAPALGYTARVILLGRRAAGGGSVLKGTTRMGIVLNMAEIHSMLYCQENTNVLEDGSYNVSVSSEVQWKSSSTRLLQDHQGASVSLSWSKNKNSSHLIPCMVFVAPFQCQYKVQDRRHLANRSLKSK